MSPEEAKEIELMLEEKDITKMLLEDQAMMMLALTDFYGRIRPILEKYSVKGMHPFLFKL